MSACVLLLLLAVSADRGGAELVDVYNLNAGRPPREAECEPEECRLDCVHTRENFTFPRRAMVGTTTKHCSVSPK